jgi:uncharacterized membrane protein
MARRRISYLSGFAIGLLLVAAAGCGRKENDDGGTPPSPPAPSSAAPVAAELSSGPVDEPAESGLAIKRAIATADGDHAIVRSCDDNADLWLIDEGDGTLTQLLTEDAQSLYIEAYGERAAVPDDLPAARGQAGVFVLEQLLYAGASGEGRGCSAPAADYVVAARGNEPFWAATVTTTGMVWKQPSAPTQITLGELQSEDAEGTVSYRARGEGHALELFVDFQPCRDSMSGEYFAFSARAILDGKEFKGCGRVGKQDAP